MRKLVSSTALAWLLAVPAVALSHSESDSHNSPVAMDCDHLPPDAAVTLPTPVSEWTRLDCRAYGQVLAQRSGWTWRYTGSFTTEVVVAAVMGEAAQRAGGARHFTAIKLSRAQGAQAQQMHERFAREVPSYGYFASEARPQTVFTLEAINDAGDTIALHFVEQSETQLWGIACTPDCRPENVFQVQKLGG